jgi:putative FmdB family regulatory protein
MPIYEYTCQDCSARFEKFVRSMTAVVEVKCPQCGGTHTKKGWSVFGSGVSGGSLGSLGALSPNACNTGST